MKPHAGKYNNDFQTIPNSTYPKEKNVLKKKKMWDLEKLLGDQHFLSAGHLENLQILLLGKGIKSLSLVLTKKQILDSSKLRVCR